MNSRNDNINLFKIKSCRHGFNCKYLNKGSCNFKHNYISENCINNKVYNDNVYKSNMHAIKNNIKNNQLNLEKLIVSYKDVQENLSKIKELKVKETLLTEKQKELDNRELQIEKLKQKNNDIYIEKLKRLSYKFNEHKRMFHENHMILNNKINFVDELIKEYNIKVSNIDCDKFINFGDNKQKKIFNSNICNICLTSIEDIEGIDNIFNILDCGHSFCYKCLNQLTKNKNIVKCPTCRNEYPVNSIKRNISLEKLVIDIKNS